MKKRTLEQWINYISHKHHSKIDLGLQRIAEPARLWNLKDFNCPVVTVAGTNGKGSVVKFLESIYLSAGYNTAAYTSPHLIRFNERLRINGEDVSDAQWIEAFEWIEKKSDKLHFSFFEMLTLTALHICKNTECDVLILEVGLGGRLDAVNIIDADVAVITSIAIDHTDWLGNDRESIAREKAGIFRAYKLAVCGDPNPPESLLEKAESLKTTLFCIERDFNYQKIGERWQWISGATRYLDLPNPRLKLQNAATSLKVVESLQFRLPTTQHAIMHGLTSASLPGRFEEFSYPESTILDVAHNPHSSEYLAKQLDEKPIAGRNLAVIGMLEDKDIAGTLEPLISCVDSWYVGSLDVMRGLQSDIIAQKLATKTSKTCYTFNAIESAYKKACQDCRSQDRIIVFGSFFTVSKARALCISMKS